MNMMEDEAGAYEQAARETVELGNRIAAEDKDADLWEVADGLLAGAIQYWLFSRQPCPDPMCEDCAPIASAEARLAELLRTAEVLAQDSEYFHAPTDHTVGRA